MRCYQFKVEGAVTGLDDGLNIYEGSESEQDGDWYGYENFDVGYA